MPATYLVKLNDVDAAGVVFAPRVCAIAHEGYEELLAACGLPLADLLAEGRWALPLVRLEAAFHAPLRHGMRVRIAADGTAWEDTGCTVVVTLRDEDGRLLASVAQTIACIALPERRRAPFPPPVRAALARLAEA